MKKRLSVFLLAMVMILSVCPVACVSAADATDDVVIYDAYISGNFVVGETLTANYSVYPENCETLDVAKTNATITWYAKDRYNNKVTLQTGGNQYVIPDNYRADITTTDENGEEVTLKSIMTGKTPSDYGIYFTIVPKNGSDESIGNMVYSHFGARILAKDETKTTTKALNVSIMPQNPEGSMRVGDTLVVRYSYSDVSGEPESGTTFQWATADTMDGAKTNIDGATGNTYQITADDVGKWFFVTVTPKNDKRTGTVVTARNHYGNAFYYPNASFISADNYTYAVGTTHYKSVKLLADGNIIDGSGERTSTGVWAVTGSSASNTNKALNIDAGKTMAFDGFYFRHGSGLSTAQIPNLVIRYSDGDTDDDGNMIWSEAINTDTTVSPGHYEYLLDKVIYARYIRLEFNTTTTETVDEETGETTTTVNKIGSGLGLDDFYPFLRNDAVISINDNGAELGISANGGNEILVSAYGTPKSAILDTINIASEKNADITSKYVDAKGEEITTDFVVDENLTNTYLTFTGEKNISTTMEIKYAGDIATNATNTEIGASNSAMLPTIEFNRNPNGKYMLSAKIYAPSAENVSLSYWTNGTWNKGAYARNFVNFYCDSNKIGLRGLGTNDVTSYHKYIPNSWHDVEVIFDYSTYDASGSGTGFADAYVYVDGKFTRSYEQTWAYKDLFSPYIVKATISDTSNTNFTEASNVKYKDVVFREVYEINSLVTPPEYTLSLMDDTTAVEKIDVNKSYTMAENLSVYHVDTVNYLATYDVTYDAEGTEIKRQLVALDGAVKANGEVATVSTGDSISTENADGTITKKEVRAFSFAPTDMVAIAKAGVWKAK